MSSAPEVPDLPTFPTTPIGNAYIYDDSGNLAGSMIRDSAGNVTYRPGQLTPEQRQVKADIESKKQSLLQRIYSTPAEYTKAAEQEAEAYATEVSRKAREQFVKDVNRIGEVSNVRGLLGSSAWRDVMKEREKTMAETGASIASQSTAMRQDLLDRKRAADIGLYQLYTGAGQEYTNEAQRNLGAAASIYGQNVNQAMSQWQTQANIMNQQYQNRLANWQATEPWRNYIMPTLTSGAQIAAMMYAASDRRLKKNIVPLFTANGVQWYEFEYNVDMWPDGIVPPPSGKMVGVMADEVKHIPDAVAPESFGQYDMVNYDVVRRYCGMENA